MSTSPTGFSSVKLPAALVQQAREAAQPLRRSVAGQVEYWATLGRVVEHTGLTVQEARTAIEEYEAAVRKTRSQALLLPQVQDTPGDADTLTALKQRVLAVSSNGTLQAHIRTVVEGNRQQALHKAVA